MSRMRKHSFKSERALCGNSEPRNSPAVFFAGSLRVIAFLLRLFLSVVFAIELTSKRWHPAAWMEFSSEARSNALRVLTIIFGNRHASELIMRYYERINNPAAQSKKTPRLVFHPCAAYHFRALK